MYCHKSQCSDLLTIFTLVLVLCEWQQYEFVDSDDRVIYRALLQPELNPVPYTNDALFGLLDGENDEYVTLARTRAYTLIAHSHVHTH